MSLLEVIARASATAEKPSLESDYPIILNPDPILFDLKPKRDEPDDSAFVKRVEGWKISQTDAEIIEIGQKFYKKLKIKLKNPRSFNKDEFINMLNSYLEENAKKVGISVQVKPTAEGNASMLLNKVGFFMGQAIVGLVLDGCIVFEIWEISESLIVNGLVDHMYSSKLVHNLIEKKRSDLLCLCIKHVSDLQVSDILSILKFFLSPPKDGYAWMVVRKEWESQALSAIEMVTGRSGHEKKNLNLAKDASILLMIAYDQFSSAELCLHYLLASPNVDDVIFSACISKLNGSEMMGFVCYLKKWLIKYEKFPQARPCPKALPMLGLKACEWVPSLENVSNCLGLILDEHFSSLVMHPEFQEEVKSIELIVSSLVSEARPCCTLGNLSANLKIDAKGYESFRF